MITKAGYLGNFHPRNCLELRSVKVSIFIIQSRFFARISLSRQSLIVISADRNFPDDIIIQYLGLRLQLFLLSHLTVHSDFIVGNFSFL